MAVPEICNGHIHARSVEKRNLNVFTAETDGVKGGGSGHETGWRAVTGWDGHLATGWCPRGGAATTRASATIPPPGPG